jgi:hypothetical protein
MEPKHIMAYSKLDWLRRISLAMDKEVEAIRQDFPVTVH